MSKVSARLLQSASPCCTVCGKRVREPDSVQLVGPVGLVACPAHRPLLEAGVSTIQRGARAVWDWKGQTFLRASQQTFLSIRDRIFRGSSR